MKRNSIHCGSFIQKVVGKYFYTSVLLALFAAWFPTGNIQAQGNLLLTPKRVIFEGNKTSESINLANSGSDTARYVISLTHFRMKEDGSFEEITQAEAGQLSAEPYLRYFPRTVVLAPNEAQVIRIQFTKTAQMASGEYRSHLYIRAIPDPTPLGENVREQPASIAVKLVPIFGISIPVIIRVGESNATANITGLSLKTSATDPPVLSMSLNRSGNMSVYGDVSVKYVPVNGQSKLVGIIKGLAVYTPNATRQVQLALDKNIIPMDCHTGKLVVEFITQVNNRDKKISEAELILQ